MSTKRASISFQKSTKLFLPDNSNSVVVVGNTVAIVMLNVVRVVDLFDVINS